MASRRIPRKRQIGLPCIMLMALVPVWARSAEIPAVAPADRLELRLRSHLHGRAVTPGEAIPWQLTGQVAGPNNGLAAFRVDLVQDDGNPAPLDLPPAAAAAPDLAAMDRPAGFTNPAPAPRGQFPVMGSGYGGTPVPRPGGGRDLLQVGGAQNVFGVAAPCDSPEPGLCQGRQDRPEPGIGRGSDGGLVLAEGAWTAPDQPGLYRVRLARARAAVLGPLSAPPDPTPVRRAVVRVADPEILFEVVAQAGSSVPARQEDVTSWPPLAPRPGDVVQPPPAAVLTRTHVRFWWPAVPLARSYRLQVFADDAFGPDGPVPGVDVAVVDAVVPAAEPRHRVTEGLEFGRSYAWRVTADVAVAAGGGPGEAAGRITRPQEGPLYRFAIAPLPANIPPLTVQRPVAGELGPGVTLYNMSSNSDPPQIAVGTAVAVDEVGRIVFFRQDPSAGRGRLSVIEQTPQGRLLILRGREGDTDVAVVEETLDGESVWESPSGRGYELHHDADLLPWGDFVLLAYDRLMLPQDGGQERLGDRILVIDRRSGQVTWEWRTIDHYDTGDGQRPIRDWTHGNAAHYDPATDSLYYSARSFSRITRIDFTSGDIIYNMGMSQPSGDTDFGDGFFIGQHDPQPLENGHVLVFDNGTTRSFVTEIAFDDIQHPSTAAVVWQQEIVDPEGQPLQIRFANGAQRLANGNTLYSACTAGLIQEIGPLGELLWSLRFGVGAPQQFCYRARRVVELEVDVPGDADGDQDLDLPDLMSLLEARGGPEEGAAGLSFPARLSDMNHDGRVDAADMVEYVTWQTGPVE